MSRPSEPAALGMISAAELLARVDQAYERLTWSEVLAGAERAGRAEHVAVARRALDDGPVVTALDGLAAATQLVEMVTGQRWSLMLAARESGATWDQIGAAVGASGEQARSRYREAITRQERCAPQFHDAARARAALTTDDREPDPH